MDKKVFKFKRSQENYKFKKIDWIIMIVITVIYGIIALIRLGNTYAPQTAWKGTDGQNIVLDFGESVDIGSVNYFTGNHGYYNLSVTAREDTGDMWDSFFSGEVNSVFSWQKVKIDDTNRYVMLTMNIPKASILEVVVTDSDGNVIMPVNADEYKPLFDEQDMYQGDAATFMSGTYFDEIYHARTAYEYIHGITSYENTHPPLGKIIIAIGILIFGMNPFGWRIMGTLFGIFMVPVIYTFAKKLFEKTWLTTLICLTFTFDFMHFTQTRISTIDVYVTFFIMVMYYFMYRYISMSFYDTSFKKTLLPLGACGVTMGFACASKWTGCYAGAGLGIIFFVYLINRYREYRYAKKNPGAVTDGIEHDEVVKMFPKYTVKTILFCLVFFVLIPAIIYTLSYIPFVSYHEGETLFQRLIGNQVDMFNYHSKLVATHAYSSHWYQWPTMVRPILFYSIRITDTVSQGISSFGNPAVWWLGIPAASFALYKLIADGDKKAGFLMLSYGAQYVPWMLVPRYTFIYHYFPSTPFVTLIIGYCMYSFYGMPKSDGGRKKVQIACIVYVVIVIALFAYFYPVLSGMNIERAFVQNYMRWFKSSWTLVI